MAAPPEFPVSIFALVTYHVRPTCPCPFVSSSNPEIIPSVILNVLPPEGPIEGYPKIATFVPTGYKGFVQIELILCAYKLRFDIGHFGS